MICYHLSEENLGKSFRLSNCALHYDSSLAK